MSFLLFILFLLFFYMFCRFVIVLFNKKVLSRDDIFYITSNPLEYLKHSKKGKRSK